MAPKKKRASNSQLKKAAPKNVAEKDAKRSTQNVSAAEASTPEIMEKEGSNEVDLEALPQVSDEYKDAVGAIKEAAIDNTPLESMNTDKVPHYDDSDENIEESELSAHKQTDTSLPGKPDTKSVPLEARSAQDSQNKQPIDTSLPAKPSVPRKPGQSHGKRKAENIQGERSKKSKHGSGIPVNRTLYLSNLNDQISPKKLKESLFMFFSTYGDIIDILITPKLRGQAHIVFASIESAKIALRQLQGEQFFEKPLKVLFSKNETKKVSEHYDN